MENLIKHFGRGIYHLTEDSLSFAKRGKAVRQGRVHPKIAFDMIVEDAVGPMPLLVRTESCLAGFLGVPDCMGKILGRERISTEEALTHVREIFGLSEQEV